MGPGIVPQPPRCAPTSQKPSPRGEGTPVRTLGRMRGRSCTQPFLVEKRGTPAYRPNGIFLLPRWATRSPPHPSPSVTASPQGEASGLCSPTRKKRPKSGHVDGPRNRRTTRTMWHPTPKRASGNERALTQGGGGHPPRLFASGLSLEKAWIPARDRAGTHLAGANLRRSKQARLPTAEKSPAGTGSPHQKGRAPNGPALAVGCDVVWPGCP